MSFEIENLERLLKDGQIDRYRFSKETARELIKAYRERESLTERAEQNTQVMRKLESALRTLRNEVRGTLRAHELAIRYDSGNSNWRCLEIALEGADAALVPRQVPALTEKEGEKK